LRAAERPPCWRSTEHELAEGAPRWLLDAARAPRDERAFLRGDATGRFRPPTAGRAGVLYAFDLLELNGQDMRREPLEVRKRALAMVLRSKVRAGIQFNDHCNDLPADIVFRHACKLGFEGIVSKRLGSPYRSGRSRDWLKMKNPAAPAVKREAEEQWGNNKRR
jgi:hypothetical protein